MRPASTSLVAHIRVHKWISIPVDFVSWVQPAHYPLILRPALAFAGNFEALLRLTVAFLSSSSSHRPALASAGNFEALLRLAVALLRLTVVFLCFHQNPPVPTLLPLLGLPRPWFLFVPVRSRPSPLFFVSTRRFIQSTIRKRRNLMLLLIFMTRW